MKCAAFCNRPGASHLWIMSATVLLVLLILFWMAFPRRYGPEKYAWLVRQKAQLYSMDAAIELFGNEFGSHPSSRANDATGSPYCGAMKLAEALVGQDLLGCHSKSIFRRDGFDATGTIDLYPDDLDKQDSSLRAESLKARKGPYLHPESANAWRLADVYGKRKTGPFPEDTYVLCDTYIHKRPGGKKTGMPILYYRANRFGTAHQPGDPNNIYDCTDNHTLLALGVPGKPGQTHPLIDPNRFCLNTWNHMVSGATRPYRPDSYILISAGRDGLYGTPDDICNFDWKYREQ